ncbi:MAG: hypothetical protein JWP63_3649, partial [Candidatus Solibacter sp.]|nr:hypothetical protein [Candidatus Solibacter sp.]
MPAYAVVWGAVLTALTCVSLGGLLLRDDCRDWGVRFVCGAAVLSFIVVLLCSVGIAYPAAFFVIGTAAIGTAAIVIGRPKFGRPRWSWWLFPFAAYFVFYLANAMAPE